MKKISLFILILLFFTKSGFIIKKLGLAYPSHFPEPAYDFDKNPLKREKIELGRILFYDPILSSDSTISCASCHSPYNAFAHTDHDLSHGIHDKVGIRNAPALFNLAWQNSFMWDGAINHLDVQSLAPISSPEEMGEDFKNVVKKLERQKLYQEKFHAAYSNQGITGEKILKALAQFQLTLVSGASKYDEVLHGISSFSAQEKRGYELFKRNCNACHTEPLFSSYSFSRNGLKVDTTLEDFGRMRITQQDNDSLLFKIPSLRNLSYTYPYMHDGRFRKLREVLIHYSEIDRSASSLPTELTSMEPLDAREQVDLIAFLLTLNDKNFVSDQENKYPREVLLTKRSP